MKAAFVKPGGALEVSECPTPEPGRGELVVKVAYCGICGSDIHMLEAGLFSPDCIVGHELSGDIAAVGDGVDGWSEGDPVVVLPLNPCFSCVSCRNGNTQICSDGANRGYGLGMNPGGFGEYMLVKPAMLFRIPEGVDMKTAALNEPWAVGVHGVNMVEKRIGDVALVMGAGPIGLMTIYALKLAGVSEIYVSEPDEYRAEKAKAAGAVEVFNPKVKDPGFAIREVAGRAPDFVFDCAGTESSTQSATFAAGARGQVVVLGVHMGSASLMPLACFIKEVQLNFSFGYTYLEFGDSLKMLAKEAIDPEVLISDVMPLADIAQAFKALKESGHTKILIDCAV